MFLIGQHCSVRSLSRESAQKLRAQTAGSLMDTQGLWAGCRAPTVTPFSGKSWEDAETFRNTLEYAKGAAGSSVDVGQPGPSTRKRMKTGERGQPRDSDGVDASAGSLG